MSNLEPMVKASDMGDDMIKRVKDTAIAALKENHTEKAIAHAIKYEFDKYDGYGWNCIVGRDFGSHIIH